MHKKIVCFEKPVLRWFWFILKLFCFASSKKTIFFGNRLLTILWAVSTVVYSNFMKILIWKLFLKEIFQTLVKLWKSSKISALQTPTPPGSD